MTSEVRYERCCLWVLNMPNLKLQDWETDLRAAAISDRYSIFREHLHFLGLSDEPALMMKGTINVTLRMRPGNDLYPKIQNLSNRRAVCYLRVVPQLMYMILTKRMNT
jgi:hypothetical protein